MGGLTLIDRFEQRVSSSGDAPALRFHDGDEWQSVSFSSWLRTSTLMAAGLVDLGLKIGDRVALLSSTRIEWVYADQAILLGGGVVVPVYETMRPRQARIILEDSGSSIAFVEGPVQLSKLLRVRADLPALRHIVYFDELDRLPEPGPSGEVDLRLDDLEIDDEARAMLLPLSRLSELGARALGEDASLVTSRRRDVTEDSLASIVYTAGTTGRPRGVALSHGAFVTQIEGNLLALPLDEEDEQVLFLPLAQILARAIYLTAMAAGCVNSFSRGYAWLEKDMADCAPTLLVAVPRVFEKLLERAQRRAAGGSELRRQLFQKAIALARRRSAAREGRDKLGVGVRAQLAVADPLVFAPLRAVFGKRFRFAVSGGAPMPLELMEFFDGAGVPILEGYGLTEHCGAASVNRFDDYRVGTVGRPLAGVEVRIAADGEVLLRSQCVMREYWNDAEATAQALAGAWLHTGDIGELDGNYLRITDRKKDVIITAGGRSIAPTPIEAQLQAIPFIDHAVVHGDRRKFLSALITLNQAAVKEWATENELGGLSFEELTQHARVFELVDKAVESVNVDLPRSDAIRRFAILQADFSLESGELTATWKTRRQFVTRKYGPILDAFYE